MNGRPWPPATYRCYGLTIRSEIELPELGDVCESGADADIAIVIGALDDPFAASPDDPDRVWRTGPACGFTVPGVARFEMHDGRRIIVDPEIGIEDRHIRLFLLGTALGVIMMQRGHLVLHGNAIRIGDECAVVIGASGAGKSTLAAEFARRGLDVLSDDVVPVDPEGRALTGYPRIKLWDDALIRLGCSPEAFEPITGSVAKFHFPIVRGDFGALPLRWVYSLETHDGDSLELEPVAGIEAFDLLREHTYRRQFIVDAATSWEHLQQCARLDRQARLVRIRRPARTRTAEATAGAILQDIERHSGRFAMKGTP